MSDREYFVHGPRDETTGITRTTLHSVRLARGRLPIRKDCTIEALQHTIYNRLCCAVVDLFLRGTHVKDVIEIELVGLC